MTDDLKPNEDAKIPPDSAWQPGMQNEDAIAASVEPTWDDAVTALHNSPAELLERMGRVRTHTQALYNSEECLKEVVVWLKAHKPAIAASVASAQGGQEPSDSSMQIVCSMRGLSEAPPHIRLYKDVYDDAARIDAFAARKVAEAVAAEREACAKWHDEQHGAWLDQARNAQRLSQSSDDADQQEYRRQHEHYAALAIIHRQSAAVIRNRT